MISEALISAKVNEAKRAAANAVYLPVNVNERKRRSWHGLGRRLPEHAVCQVCGQEIK